MSLLPERKNTRALRLQATDPRINPVPIPADTPVSGAAPGTTIGSINALAGAAASAASAAQTTASAANAALLVIASDDVLAKGEKSAVILDYTTITAEQSGIDTQAITYGQSHTAYDSAVSALWSYLASLVPAWNDTSVDTPVVGSTLRAKFADVYSTRQTLLNAISARAKVLADSAQATADYAASRPVGDITAQVLASSGTTIQSYSSTLFDFVNGAFRLQLGAGGMVQSVGGVPKLTLSPTMSRFAGDIITDGQIIGSGTNSSFAGYHGAVIGIAGPGSSGVMGYGSFGDGWAIQAVATGGNALFAQGNVSLGGGNVWIDQALQVNGNVQIGGTINGYNLLALPYAATLHSHWIWDIYPSPYSANFSFSADGGGTWTPIKLRRDA